MVTKNWAQSPFLRENVTYRHTKRCLSAAAGAPERRDTQNLDRAAFSPLGNGYDARLCLGRVGAQNV